MGGPLSGDWVHEESEQELCFLCAESRTGASPGSDVRMAQWLHRA